MSSALIQSLVWLLTIVTPASATFYNTGPWLGINACVEEVRLPANEDVNVIINKHPLPDLAAKSYVVLTDEGHIWLAEKEANTPQSIASITKLMTALVFLDHNPGWETEYRISRDDIVSGGKINLYLGDTVTVRNLFESALIASDNGASLALARSTGLSDQEFVLEMNKKAAELALLKTKFVDPIGLGDGNVAQAKDIARLAQAALNRVEIAEAVLKSEYSFISKEGKTKYLKSTDSLLVSSNYPYFQSQGGKTGYTEAAGYSFVGRFAGDQGRTIIVVVLDTGGKIERFTQAESLANWAFKHCKW